MAPLVVAVTGASGFIGSHVVRTLLATADGDGFTVRAVVRDPTNKTKTAHLQAMPIANSSSSLEFARGDLLEEGSFDDAFAGCYAVIHTAAVVLTDAKDAQKTIVDPSVKGTQNVLDSITKAGTVKRIVHTSSIAAIINADQLEAQFDESVENSWSKVDNGDPYGYAKLKAEQMVFRYADERRNDGVVAVSINPGVVLGPCLTKAHTKGSAVFVRQLVFGNVQADLFFTYVDVREVAEAHVKGIQAAAGRYILTGPTESHSLLMSDFASKAQVLIPDIKIDFVPHPFYYSFAITQYLFYSDYQWYMSRSRCTFDSAKSVSQLGIVYRPIEDSITDTISTMIDPANGWVKPRRKGGK